MTEEFEHQWEEEHVRKAWICDNRPCVVVRSSVGHYCGYAKTKLPSLAHRDTHYSGENGYISLIDVHGGVTYGIDGEGWTGFDCGHAGDVCWEGDLIISGDIANRHRSENEYTKDWQVDDVVEELESFADQLSVLEQYLGNNFSTFNTY